MSDNASLNEATDGGDPGALQEVGNVLKREGRQVAGDAKAAARKVACDQRDALADYVSALAVAATRGADELETAGYGRSAASVARTAGEVDGFAARLRAREPGELFSGVEDFTRDHPALVFGAGFAVAFGVTRFLKSSPEPDDPAAVSPTVASPAGSGASQGE